MRRTVSIITCLTTCRAARAHRLADRHFLRAAARANQKQIDQIDRADEQKEKHAALHQQKGRTDRADVIRMQWNHRRAEAGLGHHLRFADCLSRRRRCARRSVIALRRSSRPVSIARSCACRRRRNGAAAASRCSNLDVIGRKSRASEERKRKSGGKTPTIFLGTAVHADFPAEDVADRN